MSSSRPVHLVVMVHGMWGNPGHLSEMERIVRERRASEPGPDGEELQILLGGVNAPIDLDDLRAHTQYGGLYGAQEPTIQLFWQVVGAFGQEDRRKLLRFATSCSRPPLL